MNYVVEVLVEKEFPIVFSTKRFKDYLMKDNDIPD